MHLQVLVLNVVGYASAQHQKSRLTLTPLPSALAFDLLARSARQEGRAGDIPRRHQGTFVKRANNADGADTKTLLNSRRLAKWKGAKLQEQRRDEATAINFPYEVSFITSGLNGLVL